MRPSSSAHVEAHACSRLDTWAARVIYATQQHIHSPETGTSTPRSCACACGGEGCHQGRTTTRAVCAVKAAHLRAKGQEGEGDEHTHAFAATGVEALEVRGAACREDTEGGTGGASGAERASLPRLCETTL